MLAHRTVDHGLDQNFEYLDASLNSGRKTSYSIRRIREINSTLKGVLGDLFHYQRAEPLSWNVR